MAADAERERRKLLILGDDPSQRKVLEKIFADLDVVYSEASGQTLALVRRFEPDVVLFDWSRQRSRPARSPRSAAAPDPAQRARHQDHRHDRRRCARPRRAAPSAWAPPTSTTSRSTRRCSRSSCAARSASASSKKKTGGCANRPAPMALDGHHRRQRRMRACCRSIEKVAPTSATVLLLGESGTGKELLARALHGCPAARDEPFVAINCAAIPDTLLESELFGYEKGAFTGADEAHAGQARVRRRRHALPRRDRRDAGVAAGEAAARAAGARRSSASAAASSCRSTCASSARPTATSTR